MPQNKKRRLACTDVPSLRKTLRVVHCELQLILDAVPAHGQTLFWIKKTLGWVWLYQGYTARKRDRRAQWLSLLSFLCSLGNRTSAHSRQSSRLSCFVARFHLLQTPMWIWWLHSQKQQESSYFFQNNSVLCSELKYCLVESQNSGRQCFGWFLVPGTCLSSSCYLQKCCCLLYKLRFFS